MLRQRERAGVKRAVSVVECQVGTAVQKLRNMDMESFFRNAHTARFFLVFFSARFGACLGNACVTGG